MGAKIVLDVDLPGTVRSPTSVRKHPDKSGLPARAPWRLEQLVGPNLRVRLYFQTTPYRAWVLAVDVENANFKVRARTWFDDHNYKNSPPRPELTVPAVLLLERTARTAIT
jgi:hypothetical protein